MPLPEAVIFDFDGVLVDSEPLHEWAILQSLADRGWTCSHEQFLRHIVGRGDHNAYLRIAEWNHSTITPAEISALLERKWALMKQGIAAGRFTVQPGAEAAVSLAASRLPVAVCSGSVGSTVRPMLEHIGLLSHLQTVVCGDDVKMTKPDPEGYLLAAARLHASPARCIAIEDTPIGIRAAKNAGMRTLAVAHTMPADMLREADAVLDSIALIDSHWLGLAM